MIKRIIDISQKSYLHINNQQLIIEQQGVLTGTIPIEDLGVVILQHPGIVITQRVVIACQENNVVLVFCNERYLPYSVIFPLVDGNSLHSKIIQQQVNIKTTSKNRLWKSIVKQKIEEQATTLALCGVSDTPIRRILTQVKSGDKENHEAQAAQKYWRLLFGDSFRRDPNHEGLNAMLNYGYAIVRAMIARAIVGAGLHPSLGLHHRNQYNGLCLADDIMEPFRPWIDYLVLQYSLENPENCTISKDFKQTILNLLYEPVSLGNRTLPLMIACHYLAASIRQAYSDPTILLEYPRLGQRLAA